MARTLFAIAAVPFAAATVVRLLPFPICPSLVWLGVPCVGCGVTRALARIAGGDLAGAWAANPLFPIAWIVGAAILAELARVLQAAVTARQGASSTDSRGASSYVQL